MLPSQGDWFDPGWEAKIPLVTGAQPRKVRNQAKKKKTLQWQKDFLKQVNKQNRLKTSKNIKLTNHGGNECKNNIFTFFKL